MANHVDPNRLEIHYDAAKDKIELEGNFAKGAAPFIVNDFLKQYKSESDASRMKVNGKYCIELLFHEDYGKIYLGKDNTENEGVRNHILNRFLEEILTLD